MAKTKPKKVYRTENGRKIFPEKMKLWALVQADDFGQWIAAQVKAMTRHEACIFFNKHYGYINGTGLTLTGTAADKYLKIIELGGETLEYAMKMKPHEVHETCGLYEFE